MTSEDFSIRSFDLSKLRGHTVWSKEFQREWSEAANNFVDSLSTIGFVYLINHGIPEETITKAFKESKQFFELPDEIKRKYMKTNPSVQMHGYNEPGQEVFNVTLKDDLRESFDFWDWKNGQMATEDAPGFALAHLDLKNECKKLTIKLLQLLAIGLNLDDINYFVSCHSGLSSCIEIEMNNTSYSRNMCRTLYYGPLTEQSLEQAEELSEVVRCPVHTDYGTITLLFQDMAGGLQAKSPANKWLNIEPIANSIVVNLGDLLEIWSAGKLPATAHRVLIPEEDYRKRTPRQSITYFVNPDDSTKIIPLKSTKENAENYRETTPAEHYVKKIRETYSY